MSGQPPEVIVIRGAPGVGKSAAAACLASVCRHGAKVEVDILRKMIVAVDWKNQLEHVQMLDATAGLVHDLTEFKFRPVIVVDTFSGDKVLRFVGILRNRNPSRRIRSFALYASEEVLRNRLMKRPANEFSDFEISRTINADVLNISMLGERLINTTELSPEQVAQTIFQEAEGHEE